MAAYEPSRPRASALIGVLLVATCLRPAITSVGPVLTEIGNDLGLDAVALGLLGAVPLLCFAGASVLVPALTARTGHRRAVTIALAGIASAILLRSAELPGALWVGTVLIGLAITIGNVVVSGLVKRAFAARVALVTGLYSAMMGVAAALASGTSAPLSESLGGWRPSLAVWAVPTVIALVVWVAISRRAAPDPPPSSAGLPQAPRLWRSKTAWQVTGFFGLQSLSFYLLATWLPAMVTSLGFSATQAGWMLFAFQIVGVVVGPIVSGWADRLPDQRLLCAATGVGTMLAAAGAVLAPGLAWLWILVAGASIGASFPLSLALAVLRTSTPAETVRLSGMSQSFGYLIAAVGPIAAGALAAATNWAVVVSAVGALGLLQAVLGAGAGARVSGDPPQAKVV